MSRRPDRRPDTRPDSRSRRSGGQWSRSPASRDFRGRRDRRPEDRPGPGARREAGGSRESRDTRFGGPERGPSQESWSHGGRPQENRWQQRRPYEPQKRSYEPQKRAYDPQKRPFETQKRSFDRKRPYDRKASPQRFGDRRRGEARPQFAPQRRDTAAPEREVARRDGGESYTPDAPRDLIWGRHPAQAALESGRPIHRIWCTPEMRFSSRFLQLLREAKASGVLVEEVTWARLGQISGGAVHQGIVMQPAAAETLDLTSLVEGCGSLGESPLLIAVDGLTDPQNLGSIVRTAEALGAHGMVLPQRRNAGLTGSVAKVAAGALEHLPVARVVNLNRSLDALKKVGYRVIGLAEEGSVCLEEADLDGPLVVVTGSEGDGLSMLTRRTCDQLVRIPLRGTTPSLNAAVATALLLYEVARRGWMAGLRGAAPAPRLVRPALPTAPEDATPEVAIAEVATGERPTEDEAPDEPASSEPALAESAHVEPELELPPQADSFDDESSDVDSPDVENTDQEALEEAFSEALASSLAEALELPQEPTPVEAPEPPSQLNDPWADAGNGAPADPPPERQPQDSPPTSGPGLDFEEDISF